MEGAAPDRGRSSDEAPWPPLPLAAWQDTYTTLQLWMQIVGKVRLMLSPPVNHWWQVALYLTSRGLTTSPIPYGERIFQLDFDFIDHRLHVLTAEGDVRTLALEPRSVADFYHELMARLHELGLDVRIRTRPCETGGTLPFEQDHEHAAYDADAAHRFWRILLQADRVLKEFRAPFLGKCSPVHFFWGSFDLAVTRFSGRVAPEHPGGAPNLADWVTREAYSHEVSSCGFWPGGAAVAEPAFYAYAYPEPPGYRDAPVAPAGAGWDDGLSEFVLPYELVRTAASPEETLLAFLQSTYEAAATTARWDRARLDRTG
jgi:hypothetical protein